MKLGHILILDVKKKRKTGWGLRILSRGRSRAIATGTLLPLVLGLCGWVAATSAQGNAAGQEKEKEQTNLAVGSSYGSGHFGTWLADDFGLPYYRYDVDEQTDPAAKSPLAGVGTAATHLVGNDHISAIAFNHGYTQLWSSDRRFQWTNLYSESTRHFAGGYGYLNIDGQVLSTLHLDRPPAAKVERRFGVGYFGRDLKTATLGISETVYAPFGDDPVLLHDIVITNTSPQTKRASWFEYWDVNAIDQGTHRPIGLDSPRWDEKQRVLSVAQKPDATDREPLTVFATPLQARVSAFDTSVTSFFGNGGRGTPAGVAKGRLGGGIASATEHGKPSEALFALQADFVLAPGKSVVLRYMYGLAKPAKIAEIVARYRAAPDPLRDSKQHWLDYVPHADFGTEYRWLARELAWTAYQLRAAGNYEEECGYHTINQGGYYKYLLGQNLGTRSWLHYLLPMVYSEPALAREILRYTAHLQPHGNHNLLPYGTAEHCSIPAWVGPPNDLDAWFLLAAAEYGLGTRDLAFFDEQVTFYEGAERASVWDHLKLAFQHNESIIGPHGDYKMLSPWGDWADQQDQALTESVLVTAQVAYAYPRIAELAMLRGDPALAAELRSATERARRVLQAEWMPGGWYSRAWAGDELQGRGALYLEPQPWAILARVTSREQTATLVGNILRFLTGVNAPSGLGGPSKIGSAQVAARRDPEVTETHQHTYGPLGAGWIGGTSWFDLNGWLTWSFASLDGEIPNARNYAWDEYLRNSLANHANLFPNRWDGITSTDDTCVAYYGEDASRCGLGFQETAWAHHMFDWEGQNCEQPTWLVMNSIQLAGIASTERGFTIYPHLPLDHFSLAFPRVGLEVSKYALRGYVQALRTGDLVFRVHLSEKARRKKLDVRAGNQLVTSSLDGNWLQFTLHVEANSRAEWSVSWR